PVIPGKLSPENAAYVIETLALATDLCLKKTAAALVTGPVHKSNINAAGITFSGHTEFLAKQAHVPHTVMLFVIDQLKIALATTHLPLAKVPSAITKESLSATLSLLHHSLIHTFNISKPCILVSGLNPHAGENGHLGHEEIATITPT